MAYRYPVTKIISVCIVAKQKIFFDKVLSGGDIKDIKDSSPSFALEQAKFSYDGKIIKITFPGNGEFVIIPLPKQSPLFC